MHFPFALTHLGSLISAVITLAAVSVAAFFLGLMPVDEGQTGATKEPAPPTVSRNDGNTIVPRSVRVGEDGKVLLWQQFSAGDGGDPPPTGVTVCSLLLRSCLTGGRTIETPRACAAAGFTAIEGSVIYCDCETWNLMRVVPHMNMALELTPAPPSSHQYTDLCTCLARARQSHFSRSLMDVELFAVRRDVPGDGGKSRCSVIRTNVSKPSDEPLVVASGRFGYGTPQLSPDGKWLCYVCWDSLESPTELHVASIRDDGQLVGTRRVGGGQSESCMYDPRWAPDGSCLYFLEEVLESSLDLTKLCQVTSRELYACSPVSTTLMYKALLDFQSTSGNPWGSSESTFCVLNNGAVVLITTDGKDHQQSLVHVNSSAVGGVENEMVPCEGLPAHIASVCCDPSSTSTIYVCCGWPDAAGGTTTGATTELFEVCGVGEAKGACTCRQLFGMGA